MIACPSCATELPEASRFCLSCGARLAAPAAAAEERKTVTTLFCDLVGFTAMSEAADPEDVDALLARVLRPRHEGRSSPTAAPWRSSSATPWSASSACPQCTRTTPSAPCAPASACSRRSRA